MNQQIDLKQIEKKAYLSFHRDGIYDLFVGLAFLGMALDVYLRSTGIGFGILVAAIVLSPLVKKWITEPRLGYVKFSPERQLKEKQKKVVLLVTLTCTAFLGMVVSWAYTSSGGWQVFVRSLGLIPFGFVIALLAAMLGFLHGIRRYVVYSALIAATFIVGHILRLRPNWHFSILGAVLTVVGLVLTVRFMQTYPKEKRSGTDGV